MQTKNFAVSKLFDGPLDIIGDVHGEYTALQELLKKLNYDQNGQHPEGRRLVFVGDLVDRGPDSPSVVDTVMDLMERGRAQCVLGNHELNILRGGPKDGNGWFCQEYETHAQQYGHVYPWKRVANLLDQKRYQDFFRSLPLALERKGTHPLRIVHALWSSPSLAELSSVRDMVQYFHLKNSELKKSKTQEERIAIDTYKKTYNLRKRRPDPPPVCPELANYETRVQMNNPVKILTSGAEGPIKGDPPFLSNQYRMVERLSWWDDYTEEIPVIIGHYWRSLRPNPDEKHRRLFKNATPKDWLGPNKNVYCIDFSVGRRYRERADGHKTFINQLGALRTPSSKVPAWNVVLSNGRSFSLELPGVDSSH